MIVLGDILPRGPLSYHGSVASYFATTHICFRNHSHICKSVVIRENPRIIQNMSPKLAFWLNFARRLLHAALWDYHIFKSSMIFINALINI